MKSPVILLALFLCVPLAGCAIPEVNDRFPSHNETRSQKYPNFENLVVSGTLFGGGEHVLLRATAKNEGPHTYKVSSICTSPWSDSLMSSLGDVHRTEPMATCAAFGLKEFKPGESLPFEAKWNGTLWDSDRQGFVDAASGRYTWHLSFHVYKGGNQSHEFEAQDTIRLAFAVTVQ